MKDKMLNAWSLECPYCESTFTEVRQLGHFVSTLFLVCGKCGLSSNFIGPIIIEI